MRITKTHIEYIEFQLKEHGNVSIYIPNITAQNIKTLEKYFTVKKEIFGYVKFTRKQK